MRGAAGGSQIWHTVGRWLAAEWGHTTANVTMDQLLTFHARLPLLHAASPALHVPDTQQRLVILRARAQEPCDVAAKDAAQHTGPRFISEVRHTTGVGEGRSCGTAATAVFVTHCSSRVDDEARPKPVTSKAFKPLHTSNA